MSRSFIKYAASAATVLALGTGLVACTGGGDAAEKAPGVDASGNAEWSVTVDGEALEITDAAVVCAEEGGKMNIAIGSQNTAEASGVSAVLDAESLTVEGVGLGSLESGEALAYAPGVPGNEATATKDGDTYEITGTVTAADMNDPMAGPTEKSFEMKVTCP